MAKVEQGHTASSADEAQAEGVGGLGALLEDGEAAGEGCFAGH